MTESGKTIEEIIAEFMLAAEQGDAPQPEDFVERYPAYANDLKEFFAVHEQFASSSQASGVVASRGFPTTHPTPGSIPR